MKKLPISLLQFILGRLRGPAIVAMTATVLLFLTSYLLIASAERSGEIESNINISAKTITATVGAGDIDLALIHILSITDYGDMFDVQVNTKSGTHILGPIGNRGFGIGVVCKSINAGQDLSMKACKRLISINNLAYLAGFGVASMAIVWLVLAVIRRRFESIVRLISDSLLHIIRAQSSSDIAIGPSGNSGNFTELIGLREKIENLFEDIQKSSRFAAIAQMTQMLAHDVRKPFSILRMGLEMLGDAKDPASVKSVLSRLVPEIDKAVSSVDGLISDVMEVGSTSTQLIQEPVSPESLIETILREIFQVYPKSKINISYDLQHTHKVNVHALKIGRVFANIIGNAIQAMANQGKIWIKTREQDGFVEFSLGNAGSIIAAEDLPKLFESFFTSGKKGGTGLGLAIAQKVVHAHGGQIWCESKRTAEHPDGYVEFRFTLPIAHGMVKASTARLPAHSDDIIKAIQVVAAEPSTESSVDKDELALETDIVATAMRLGRPLSVLIVDDEAVYRVALTAYLSRTTALMTAIELCEAQEATTALDAAAGKVFDLVITDVDMGAGSLKGFELVKELKAKGLDAPICVHSNRIVAADHKSAIEAGADAFLPKPMARAQLLRLLLQAVDA